MIVARPDVGERKPLEEAELSTEVGLVGDNWLARDTAVPEAQITLMNSRIIQLLTQDREHWPLAGDQLFVDFDISMENLPPGQQIRIGTALLEISELPHTGCKKFMARFGEDALAFISTPEGRAQRMRGVNARVIQGGAIRVGDAVVKV